MQCIATSHATIQLQELTASKGDLQGTQKELDAANAYFDKLKPVPRWMSW